MTMKPIYEQLAGAVEARFNCEKMNNQKWLEHHSDTIQQIVDDFLPSGSGFDNGTAIDLKASNGDRLVFFTTFHHMDANGYYDGWTEHKVTVKPSLTGHLKIEVSGRDLNNIKDYITEVFLDALTTGT